MLTWMQRHKKWLVVTLWISVIAFIGAGFVGWGSYDLNLNRSSNVAKVGDEKISFTEFDRRYAQIFGYYQNISNGTLTPEQAKEQRLDAIALQSLIEDKLLINFAKKLGISVSEDEILTQLISDRNFWDLNGTFSKEIYYEVLRQNELKSAEFEKILSDGILLRKISVFFDLGAKQNEVEMLASNLYMQDRLEVASFKAVDDNKSIDEALLMRVYDENKENLIVPRFYKVSSYFLPVDTSHLDANKLKAFYEENKAKYTDFAGKILSFDEAKNDAQKDFALSELRKNANETYLKLSKKELDFQKEQNITDLDIYYPLDELAKAKNGSVLKPFEFNQDGKDGFLIIRLDLNSAQRVKSFEEARNELLPLYEKIKHRAFLRDKANLALADFKGETTGFINRDSVQDGVHVDKNLMNDAQFAYFLQNVFNSDLNTSAVIFDDKAILYKIKAQKLENPAKVSQYKEALIKDVRDFKSAELRVELLKELEKLYPVQIYYKGN